MGMKSWDLQACDRASTIAHVDREKKMNTQSLVLRASDYVFIHQSPSLCNDIQIPGPGLLAI